MKLLNCLISGAAGAVALTALHESARRVLPNAPRMDLLGMRAIARGLEDIDVPPPAPDKLHTLALAGDLLSNSLYYSLVGSGENALLRGGLLGLAAGIGGVVLPGPLGLGSDASARTTQTKIMTTAWYLLGGLVAGAVAHSLGKGKR